MKTDLSKILSITGQSGLFRYVAQARNGAVAESLLTGKRCSFGLQIMLKDIAYFEIYTDSGDVKLREVLLKMKDALADGTALSSKSSPDELKAFFGKVLPEYDRDRFYVSHMKKVIDWYNCLRDFASLDFEDPEAEKAEGEQAEAAPAAE